MSHFRLLLSLAAGCALALPTLANAQATSQSAAAQPPVAYASVNELNNILGQLKQAAQNIQTDLGKARIEKWKTDSTTKRQTQGNVDSIQRNLESALPELVTQVNNAPEDLGATFKLYRNLDALYDVFRSVAESAGAFGSKDDFQSLSNDITALESVRRSLGERIQNLATTKEGELTRLRGQVKAMQAGPPAPPKKIIVDDTEPPKKPAKKKAPKPAPAAPTSPQTVPPPK
jgi:chromosome segregation ATPase